MVGRLVKENKVGPAKKDLGNFNPHLPSAAEFRHGAVKILTGKTKPGEHSFHISMNGTASYDMVTFIDI